MLTQSTLRRKRGLHIVFVTKYRRKTLTAELLAYLKTAFADCLTAWRCSLVEFGGEPDRVHLLIDVHPALDISVLINNLKTASARRTRARFAEHLATFYSKPLFWHRAYFVVSVGGATLEIVRAYVDAQGTEKHARKAAAKTKSKTKPSACPPPVRSACAYMLLRNEAGLGRGMRGQVFNIHSCYGNADTTPRIHIVATIARVA
jgi:putative transposase